MTTFDWKVFVCVFFYHICLDVRKLETHQIKWHELHWSIVLDDWLLIARQREVVFEEHCWLVVVVVGLIVELIEDDVVVEMVVHHLWIYGIRWHPFVFLLKARKHLNLNRKRWRSLIELNLQIPLISWSNPPWLHLEIILFF